LSQAVENLLYKLKELYYNRKTKPQKGKYKKINAPPKKRYLTGLNEISKNLRSDKLNMIIIATNLERVQESANGLDAHLKMIIKECYSQKIPLIYCFTRATLGRITKRYGCKASITGIFNY